MVLLLVHQLGHVTGAVRTDGIQLARHAEEAGCVPTTDPFGRGGAHAGRLETVDGVLDAHAERDIRTRVLPSRHRLQPEELDEPRLPLRDRVHGRDGEDGVDADGGNRQGRQPFSSSCDGRNTRGPSISGDRPMGNHRFDMSHHSSNR